jgi:hypothetical protein
MTTAVIDTNVVISAFVGHGKPQSLVTKLLEEHVVVTSREMLAELADVLSREKFKEVKETQAKTFVSILASKSVLVRTKQHLRIIPEDPDDDMVLNTALSGKADYIVTGDTHLLNLREFRGIRIVTVNEMVQLLRTRSA